MSNAMTSGRRTGGAPWWIPVYAVLFAATLLVTLTVIYLTTVHVRTAVARFSRDASVPRPVRGIPYAGLINRTAAAEHLNPALLGAIVTAESGFNRRARSARGAYGLMQIMPATWRELGGTDTCPPAHKTPSGAGAPGAAESRPPQTCMDNAAANLAVGAAYLHRLIDRFGGNAVLAVAAYNAGATPVLRHRGVPPFPETARYMRQVALAWYHLEYQGTLSPFWFAVIRSFDVLQRARGILIGAVAVMSLRWALPQRRSEAGGIVLTGASR